MQRDLVSPPVSSPSAAQSGMGALYHHRPGASVPHEAASPASSGPQTPYSRAVPHRPAVEGMRHFQPHPPPHPRPMSPVLAPSTPLTAQDIAALAARFTNKPTSQGYEHEARTTLEASQSEPAVRHALASLRSLYKTLEDHGHEFPHGRLAVPTVYHGLQEYHNAIVNLTSKLSVVDRRSCEVALVCCRLFISIETMQRDYVSVAEHYIRGMRIMHESATRPYLDARGNVIPTQNGDFPKIDSFMIKIFMSPDRMAPACTRTLKEWSRGERRRRREGGKGWRRGRAERSMGVVRLARNEVRAARVKARLLVLSELVLMHFENVSRLRPGSDPGGVVAERRVLLEMLREFDLEGRDGERDLGPYHGRFHLLYHAALKIAVTLSLWAPTEDLRALQPIFDRVAVVARLVI
ncbi:uncharacterized protein DNG_01718 [Cephalotrichum gorgonifer]|uniref:Uncharacterized protein n=1 Tax=Cephalotrichum gorgonifer TaxID=2041049 RepID=A0AAE8SS22_9PEZI|nr:uncharacterized protein DNG_01718 [Cephalotrichum gorgonifer]